MNEIIWLASYPKSGNTWFRTFISNLLNENDEEVSINQLKTDGIFSSRTVIDSVLGIESSDLTFHEIDKLRPKVYNHIAENLEKNLYIKVHDAYTYLEDGTPLMGTKNSKAIYILRNPLDVAVSFANHALKDLDTMIADMGNQKFDFCGSEDKIYNQLRQKLLTWSSHVESWHKASEIMVHFIRYEDMKFDPLKTFTEAVKFIGLDVDEEQIKEAISKSDFNKLKKEEQKNGFWEKPYDMNPFFREGKVGDWRNHLTEQQVETLIENHREVMMQFGYLDENGKVVY